MHANEKGPLAVNPRQAPAAGYSVQALLFKPCCSSPSVQAQYRAVMQPQLPPAMVRRHADSVFRFMPPAPVGLVLQLQRHWRPAVNDLPCVV